MKAELRLGYIDLITENSLEKDALECLFGKTLWLSYVEFIVFGSMYRFRIKVKEKEINKAEERR